MSPDPLRPGNGLRALLMAAAGVVLVAGLKAAAGILVPVLAAAFLAILTLPPIHALQKRGVPDWLAVGLVFVGMLTAGALASVLIGGSVAAFMNNLPSYEASLRRQLGDVASTLQAELAGWGFNLSVEAIGQQVDASSAMRFAGWVIASVRDILSNVAFVLLTVGFILAEAAGLPRKIRAAVGDPNADLSQFTGVVDGMHAYLRVKTRVSMMTGLLAYGTCAAVGLDFAALWGLIAFFLNYIPTLGSIIAAIPAVLLSLVQLGWQSAGVLLVAYLVINTVMGNVLEPRWMGRRLGLSSLVVFLSLVFWGWVWGGVGMLLCVPLTMLVKILLEQSDDLRWIGVLLGSGGDTSHHLAEQTKMIPARTNISGRWLGERLEKASSSGTGAAVSSEED